MAIANVALTNTFDEWRTRTNQIIVSLDQNDTITALAFDKANSANYYTYLVDVNSKASFLQSNTAYLVANNGYNRANSANYYSYLVDVNSKASFLQSNTAYLVANNGYNKANSANIIASAAFDKANTACTTADTAQSTGVAAFLKGNTAHLTANAAFTTANAALPSSSYTASDVLTKIKTVDGSTSGLDADLLDGQDSTYYQPASSAITTTNIGSQSVNYASSAGNADTVDGYHGTAFVRAVSVVNPTSPSSGYQTLGSVSASIASGTLTITLNWVDIAEHPYVPPPPPPPPPPESSGP